jgi:hypothetical protein
MEKERRCQVVRGGVGKVDKTVWRREGKVSVDGMVSVDGIKGRL